MSEETKKEDNIIESTKQSRWKSPVLWGSIVGAISVILTALGVWDKIGITSETFGTVVSAIGSILIALGILNNPTDKDGF